MVSVEPRWQLSARNGLDARGKLFYHIFAVISNFHYLRALFAFHSSDEVFFCTWQNWHSFIDRCRDELYIAIFKWAGILPLICTMFL